MPRLKSSISRSLPCLMLRITRVAAAAARLLSLTRYFVLGISESGCTVSEQSDEQAQVAALSPSLG